MILQIICILWIVFISLIYLDLSPLIMALSLRGLDWLLTPSVTFGSLVLAETVFMIQIVMHKKRHGYGRPIALASLALAAVLIGSMISPPLLLVGVIAQITAMFMDLRVLAHAPLENS